MARYLIVYLDPTDVTDQVRAAMQLRHAHEVTANVWTVEQDSDAARLLQILDEQGGLRRMLITKLDPHSDHAGRGLPDKAQRAFYKTSLRVAK